MRICTKKTEATLLGKLSEEERSGSGRNGKSDVENRERGHEESEIESVRNRWMRGGEIEEERERESEKERRKIVRERRDLSERGGQKMKKDENIYSFFPENRHDRRN